MLGSPTSCWNCGAVYESCVHGGLCYSCEKKESFDKALAEHGGTKCLACGGFGCGKIVNQAFVGLPGGHIQCPACYGKGEVPDTAPYNTSKRESIPGEHGEELAIVHPLLISGKQGSGKSSTADLLAIMLAGTGKFNVVRYKFAQTIYTMHDLVLDVLRQMGIDVPKKDGRLLQLLGSDWGRTVYGPDIWVKCALAAYDMTAKNYSATTVFLIDDCRFVNEAEAFRPLNGFLVRLDASQAVRKARCSAWRETEGHDSEISLDHYQGFNQRIDTDRPGIDAPQVAAEIMREFLSHVGKLHV